jgi:hypothetical protein
MMIASDAAARFTLVSVIAPTPRSMTRSDTSSPTSILASASSSASTEPDTSPLRMRLSSWLSPFSMEAMKSSSVRRTRRWACQGGALAGLTLLGDLASGAVVLDDEEVLTGTGHRGETEHHRRT